jgi:hypothetical protein
MLTRRIIILCLTLLLLSVTSLAFAQRSYNSATIETIAGTVESVDKTMNTKGNSYGIHLKVKTVKETLSVHLGPAWYIDKLDTKIEKGDKIEVKGSRVVMAGKPAIIAAEVKKGNSTMHLRDENGRPAWAGKRGKNQ